MKSSLYCLSYVSFSLATLESEVSIHPSIHPGPPHPAEGLAVLYRNAVMIIHFVRLTPARYHDVSNAWPSTDIPLILAGNIVIHLLLLPLLLLLPFNLSL